MSRECVTHHHACDCREEMHKQAITERDEIIKELQGALEFYSDKDKYFMRESEIDINQTTAVFKSEYKADLTKPNIHKFKVYECSARLKADQGNTAREALTKLEKWREGK